MNCLSFQSFLGFAFDYGPENDLTGGRHGVYNLDGTSNFNMGDATVNTVGNFFPSFAKGFGAVPKGLSIGKLNAAQFSKTFKGNLSRLPAGTRGNINVGMNKGIEFINGQVLDPTLVTNLQPYDKKK